MDVFMEIIGALIGLTIRWAIMGAVVAASGYGVLHLLGVV